MALATYNIEDAPSFDAFSEADARELDCLKLAFDGTYVASGCGVSAQSSPNMTVAGATGTACLANVQTALAGSTSITISAASSNDRIDLISYGSGGYTVTTGTPCTVAGWTHLSGANPPVMPSIPAGHVPLAAVYVAANGDPNSGGGATTAIYSANIRDLTTLGPPSPLTTKGDLFGFGSADARLPVGSNGYVLQADSSQTLGLGYSTTTVNFNNQLVENANAIELENISILEAPYLGGIGPTANLLVNFSQTGDFTNVAYQVVNVAPSLTINSASESAGEWPNFRLFATDVATFTSNLSSTEAIAEIVGFHSEMLFEGSGSWGNQPGISGFQAEDFIAVTGAMPVYRCFYAWPKFDCGTGGSITVGYGFHYGPGIVLTPPTTEWAFAAERGNNYWNGLSIFGAGSGTPAAVVNIQGTGWTTPTNLFSTIYDTSTRTIASEIGGAWMYAATGGWTVTYGQGFSGVAGVAHLGGTYTISGSGAITNFAVIDARPTLTGTVAPGGATVIYLQPTFLTSATISLGQGVAVFPTVSSSTTITKWIGLASGFSSNAGTVTTTVGLDIGVTSPLLGTTIWGMQVGNYQSYHQGPMTFGGTSAPNYAIDMQLANSAQAAIGMASSTTAATKPANNAGAIQLYEGTAGNFYWLLIFVNSSGTEFYTYTKTGAIGTNTWTTATSLPA